MNKCKICGGQLIHFHTYKVTANRAQYFAKSKNEKDSPIDLILMECIDCGIIQVPMKAVKYFNHAIKSPDWTQDKFRIYQKEKFIQQFSLQNKKIIQIEDQPIADNYDAFFLFNYLQHFPNPRKVLKQIYNNLPDNGVGIVQVPNFDQIIRNQIFAEFIIDHLYYFTSNTLKKTLQISGFDVLRIQQIWQGASLSATVKKRPLLNKIPFIENQKKLVQDIDKFIENNYKVTIWGAGHQTLMLLMMIRNIDKIQFIIDDFIDKQNLYTPVTHKLVYPSQYLLKNSVNGIIISVGWQYKKVLQRIKKLKLSNINFSIIDKATLRDIKI